MKDQPVMWTRKGRRAFFLDEPADQLKTLPLGIYRTEVTPRGEIYLEWEADKFTFDYKLYGLEDNLINRVDKTWANTKGNLGVLLNGLKGTGKSVSAKVMCNKLQLPVVVVDSKIDGVHTFLNTIPQNIIVFLDEYEKIFGESSEMLTIMDGALNSAYRRFFVLTCNKLYVDRNLIERPSRIRYLKTFGHLTPKIVEEIVDDMLVHKEFRDDVVHYISTLEVISVDVVKAVVTEVNIHKEPPAAFEEVFNAERLSGNYTVLVQVGNEWKTLAKDCKVNCRPKFNSETVGNWFQADNNIYGRVTRVIDWNTLEVTGVKDEGKIRKGQVKTPIIVKVKESYTYHDNYLYDSDVTPPVHVEHVATGLGLKPDTSRGDSSQALIDFPKITGGTKRFRSGEDDEESMDG